MNDKWNSACHATLMAMQVTWNCENNTHLHHICTAKHYAFSCSKMLISIKHVFQSWKASFFWIMAGACENVAHLHHFHFLTVLCPLPKERQTTFPKISNSLGRLETQSCRMKLTNGDVLLTTSHLMPHHHCSGYSQTFEPHKWLSGVTDRVVNQAVE